MNVHMFTHVHSYSKLMLYKLIATLDMIQLRITLRALDRAIAGTFAEAFIS